jgi:stage II sporulation protein GA (sporulation sigma-E factor processing peptidase)
MTAFTVYLDQVFLGNMVMNYIILWAAAKISRVPVGKTRLAAGAALGAGYAVVALLPGCSLLLTIGFKTAASIIITAATFFPVPLRKFITCLGCFYLTSFVLGGLVFGVIFFFHAGLNPQLPAFAALYVLMLALISPVLAKNTGYFYNLPGKSV